MIIKSNIMHCGSNNICYVNINDMIHLTKTNYTDKDIKLPNSFDTVMRILKQYSEYKEMKNLYKMLTDCIIGYGIWELSMTIGNNRHATNKKYINSKSVVPKVYLCIPCELLVEINMTISKDMIANNVDINVDPLLQQTWCDLDAFTLDSSDDCSVFISIDADKLLKIVQSITNQFKKNDK